MRDWNDMITLAGMLQKEHQGDRVNTREIRDLARRLLPHHPEIRNVLTSIDARLSRA